MKCYVLLVIFTASLFASSNGIGSFSNADVSSAQFVYYYGPNFENSQSYDLSSANDILKHENFDVSRDTVVYVHGYLENRTVESTHVVVDAYLTRGDHNVVFLDWGEIASGNYLFSAVPGAKKFGPVFAKTLLNLFNAGLEVDKFHLVGHSLGGQLVGMAGREIKRRSGGKTTLKRITVLDPAFPPFYFVPIESHVSASDAEFVDVIHTDAGLYGAPVETGTVDFWPNSGKTTQPGCPKRNFTPLSDNDLCSHRRSWRFWAESVSNQNPEKFLARRASSWSDFKRNNAHSADDVIVMGIDTPFGVRGSYYLQTNEEAPYARGQVGTRYQGRA